MSFKYIVLQVHQYHFLIVKLNNLFIEIPCNGGQVYQVCPNECVRTCSNIALDPNCVQSKDCAEGCGCPANQTLNDEGECIKIKDCPCTFGGNEYPAGFLTKMEDKIW